MSMDPRLEYVLPAVISCTMNGRLLLSEKRSLPSLSMSNSNSNGNSDRIVGFVVTNDFGFVTSTFDILVSKMAKSGNNKDKVTYKLSLLLSSTPQFRYTHDIPINQHEYNNLMMLDLQCMPECIIGNYMSNNIITIIDSYNAALVSFLLTGEPDNKFTINVTPTTTNPPLDSAVDKSINKTGVTITVTCCCANKTILSRKRKFSSLTIHVDNTGKVSVGIDGKHTVVYYDTNVCGGILHMYSHNASTNLYTYLIVKVLFMYQHLVSPTPTPTPTPSFSTNTSY